MLLFKLVVDFLDIRHWFPKTVVKVNIPFLGMICGLARSASMISFLLNFRFVFIVAASASVKHSARSAPVSFMTDTAEFNAMANKQQRHHTLQVKDIVLDQKF
jgi:hypothetical protein